MRFLIISLLCIFPVSLYSLGSSESSNRRRSADPPAVQSSADSAAVNYNVIPDEPVHGIIIKDLPETPWFIMGRGETGAEILVSFLLNENRNADRAFVESLTNYYINESVKEGINHDIAFVQMCLETGFLRFGGLVLPEMNNFCGLGAIGPGETGLWFPSVELGVRAHIQHLHAYASTEPLKGELVDPRYSLVRRGSSPVIQGLSGTWAADKLYADKIEAILKRLHSYRDAQQ